MLKLTEAIVKDGKIWKRGRFNEKEDFITEGEFEKLSDAKGGSKTKMLKTVVGEDKVEDILKEKGFTSIYIVESKTAETSKKKGKVPPEETVEQFDERWWKDQNNKCLECTKKCKQSGKADVVYCSDYEEGI